MYPLSAFFIICNACSDVDDDVGVKTKLPNDFFFGILRHRIYSVSKAVWALQKLRLVEQLDSHPRSHFE